MFNINDFNIIKEKLFSNSPLIHCITNPISINDCANFVLATGAKPIMAEHPLEVEEITSRANALAVNIGNITDARLKSIRLSAKKASELNIPWIIDIVGVNCSKLRFNYAKELINNLYPSVIKGNMSEIKAISYIENTENHGKGIDVTKADATTNENISENILIVKNLANKYNTVIIASGKIDIITDGNIVYTVENGCNTMSLITGTGCILNVLTAAMLSVSEPLTAGVMAASLLGVAGELADSSKGTGTFKLSLLDVVSTMTPEKMNKYAKVKRY